MTHANDRIFSTIGSRAHRRCAGEKVLHLHGTHVRLQPLQCHYLHLSACLVDTRPPRIAPPRDQLAMAVRQIARISPFGQSRHLLCTNRRGMLSRNAPSTVAIRRFCGDDDRTARLVCQSARPQVSSYKFPPSVSVTLCLRSVSPRLVTAGSCSRSFLSEQTWLVH